MKLLIINNTSSGPTDGSIYDFIRYASNDGDELDIRVTDGTTDVRSMLADATDFDAVVVAGGDGTIAAVAYSLAGTGVPILPFPAGTANLLANNLLSPMEPYALATMLHEKRTLDFDLGEIVAGDERFGFCIMAGAGYDATIMHDAKPAKKRLGSMAYFQAAVANPTPQVSKIRLIIDGKPIDCEGLGIVLVNFSKIQFDITVTHDNRPRDGQLDIVVLKTENAFGLIPALFAGLLDRSGRYPSRTEAVEIYHGCTVEAQADPPFQIQYDGEVPDASTPFTARVLDGAARFIVSEPCIDQFGDGAANPDEA
jgi:diacylglycerol kinase family enzyme